MQLEELAVYAQEWPIEHWSRTRTDLRPGFTAAMNRRDNKPPGERVALAAFRHILDYALHARSEVEWKKSRLEFTDRTAGKEGNGRRVALKG
jgi:hypothetical protein